MTTRKVAFHKTKLNFARAMKFDTNMTPHGVFEALAIDAALLRYNEELPALGDEERQRLLNVAQVAAQTVIKMAHVSADWLSFVNSLNADPIGEVRNELWDIIFDLMGPAPKHVTEEECAVMDRIRTLCRKTKHEELHEALLDLEMAYFDEIINTCEQAFRVGYQLAHDPSRLIFEKDEE